MSLAGPGANFALTVLAAALIHVGIWSKILAHPDSANFAHIVVAATPGIADGLAALLSVLFSLNILLGAFNLLPIPPLDGFGAVGLLIGEDAAGRFQEFGQQIGRFSMIGLLIAWQLFGQVFHPIFILSLQLLYPGYGYGS
jgi:Zn-dependent protease